MALQDFYNPGDTEFFESVFVAPNALAQTFTSSSAYSATSIKVLVSRQTSSAMNVTLELQETTAGEPNGSVIASKILTVSSFSETPGFVEFVFTSPVALLDGTVYAIVITQDTEDNAVQWHYPFPSDYANGAALVYDGEAWSDLGIDFQFEVYGDGGSAFEDMEATIPSTGTVSATLTKKFINNNIATNTRLVAAGANSVWIEDV